MNKKWQKEVIEKISQSENKNISSVMANIEDVIILDLNDNAGILKEKIRGSKNTYFPVSDGNKENLIGIINIKDILENALSGLKIDLKEGIHEPVYFSEGQSIQQAFSVFMQSNIRAAFIINKENNITGFLSIQDIVNYLLGNKSCNS